MTESNPFRPVYRELSDAEKELVEQIKDSALALSLLLDQIARAQARATLPAQQLRYRALALTALEEAVMWATKAVTT